MSLRLGSNALFRALVCLCVVAWTPAAASLDPARPLASFVREGWQTAQGLPHDSILATAQTDDGFIWFGTEEGLVRFDGLRFTLFGSRRDGLKNKTIAALAPGKSNSLWIGTAGGGLAKYQNGAFTSYTTREGLPSDSVLSVVQDRDGTVWAGTDGAGLAALRNGHFRVYTKSDGLPDNVVFSVAMDSRGTVWAGTRNGVASIAGGQVSSGGLQSLEGKHIRSLAASKIGFVWAGTETDGLYLLSQGSPQRFTVADGLTANTIVSLREDRAGSLWVGTSDAGLFRLSRGTFTSLSQADGLLGSDVESLLEDREGNLWVGTATGLNCLKTGLFDVLGKREGLNSEAVLPVLEDDSGSLWIGSDHGITRWRDGKAIWYGRASGLPDDLVLSIAQDSRGNIWAGTRHGVARLVGDRFATFDSNSGLPNDFVVCMLADRRGNLWVGSRGGLTKFDGTNWSTLTTRDGLANNFVRAIAEAPDASLWIGTEGGGLVHYKDGRFSTFNGKQGLSNDTVRAVAVDPDGTVWAGTNGGGLNRLAGGRICTFTTEKGLFDDRVFSILDDSAGSLWLTSNRGVFSLNKQQLASFAQGKITAITSASFGTADGLRTRECNGGFQPASCRLRNGTLAFPTMGGLALLDRKRLAARSPLIIPLVEQTIVDGTGYGPATETVAPPGRGQLQFDFSAPSFTSPENVELSYMLDGFDRDWTPAGLRRTAYYTNIPHGHYTFRVRTTAGALAAVDLRLKPHFYQSFSFLLFLCVVGVSLSATAYDWRMNQVREREHKLLAVVKERTAALSESERLLRRSRDEMEIRIQERTIELVRMNHHLQTEMFVWKRTERQIIAEREEAEALRVSTAAFVAQLSHQIQDPAVKIADVARRIGWTDNEAVISELECAARSLSDLATGIQVITGVGQ